MVPLFVVAGAAVVIVGLLLIIWSVKRRHDVKLHAAGEDSVVDLAETIAGLTHGTLVDGSRLESIENGAYFDAVLRAIDAAEALIHLETFLWKEGSVAARFAEALAAKARAGISVRILFDGSGGKQIRPRLRALRDAGCKVVRYHRFSPRNIGRVNNRDHRKIVIVDGRIGFAGGHCLTDDWLGDAEDKKHFRDLFVRVEGPIVHGLQSAFCENWVEETGDLPIGDDYFPELEPWGESRAHLAFVTPMGSVSTIKILHYIAICAANRSITIQNPYFLPDPEAIDALIVAAGRDVDVRVMLREAAASDAPIVQHASHRQYGALLKGGVRILEYGRTLLHQKVFVVDGTWAAIGSTNFDDRSFETNDEVSLSIFDETFAAQLTEVFERDLAHCREVKLKAWKSRGVRHRLLDFATYLVNEQL